MKKLLRYTSNRDLGQMSKLSDITHFGGKEQQQLYFAWKAQLFTFT